MRFPTRTRVSECPGKNTNHSRRSAARPGDQAGTLSGMSRMLGGVAGAVISACTLLLGSITLTAQDYWEHVPLDSPVYSIAFNSQGHIYVGSDSAKVLRSTDGGQTFEKFFVRPGGSAFDYVGEIAINSVDSVFVTLFFFTTSRQSTWRSGDSGETWTQVFDHRFSQIIFDESDTIYASLSTSFSITVPPTIRVSSDHGNTWTQIEKRGIHSLVRNAAGHLFAGTFNAGIDKSIDGGSTWSSVFLDGTVTAGLMHITDDQRVHAIYGTVYASSDVNGENWQFRNPSSSGLISSMAVSGNDVFVGFLGDGVHMTSDAGVTWTKLDTSGLDNHLWLSEHQQIAVDKGGFVWVAADNASSHAPRLFRSRQAIVTDVYALPRAAEIAARLSQNYPNPFCDVTTVAMTLPRSEDISLTVYDMLGRVVEVLASGRYGPGRHEFVLQNPRMSTGVYAYRLSSGEHSESRRMTVVR